MNGGHLATVAKIEYICTGLVLTITLGFYVIWEMENLSHTLNCFSEKKIVDVFSLEKLFLANTL